MRILYVVYWGALEQLGQSLVVPAVRKMSEMGVDLTLVTFEKPSDLARTDEMNRVRNRLSESGVDWLPLKYNKTPKLPATVFDIASGVAKGIQKRLKKRYDIVHGRSYPGGLIGVVLAPLIGAKFVYHNEGFYPDEQVDGGFWEEGSRTHRIAKNLENLMYSRADGIIALSNRSKVEIENYLEVKYKKTPVVFVPSCVDLDRFSLPENRPIYSGGEVKLVYIGSVGGRYRLDKISSFVETARTANSDVTLRLYSRADRKVVKDMMANGGLSDEFWSQDAIPYLAMPETLANYQAGIHFLNRGISEHSGSPTKIGEYWAVGLPIVITPNISDTEDIIAENNVGVIVKEHTREAYIRAFDELKELLKDPHLSTRCRQAATDYYNLEPACERQMSLYKQLL